MRRAIDPCAECGAELAAVTDGKYTSCPVLVITMAPGGGVTHVGDTNRVIRRPIGDGGGERRLCSKCAIDGYRPMNLERSADCSDATNDATTGA